MTVKKVLILLNDTDPLMARVCRSKFKLTEGWDAILTSSVKEAIIKTKENKPDAVITEILLKDPYGKNGFDYLTEIKKFYKGTTIIFTELQQEEDKKKAKELGAQHYFVKSDISIQDLIDKVKKIIRS